MRIPGYNIIDTLGEGGMAVVYLAIQEGFEREVALKVLDSRLSKDPNFGERFLREARIVSRLVHPNIVTVYDLGVHEGNHYLSMEYVPGRDLKHCRFDLTLQRSLEAVKDIARALDYAARKGCVHRDVKPDNIMLHEEDGRAVLMDFGIARIVDHASEMTQTGTTLGTPHYMSPEQARGGVVDARSDLYSLGVVLFLLLTGYLPYDSDSAVSIGVMHLTEAVPRLPEHLTPFQPIINRVLAKDPEQRYQTGAELSAALDQITAAQIADMERVGEGLFAEGRHSEAPTSQQTAVHQTPVGWDREAGEQARPSPDTSQEPEQAPVTEELYALRDEEPEAEREPSSGMPVALALLLVLSLGGTGYYFRADLFDYWAQVRALWTEYRQTEPETRFDPSAPAHEPVGPTEALADETPGPDPKLNRLGFDLAPLGAQAVEDSGSTEASISEPELRIDQDPEPIEPAETTDSVAVANLARIQVEDAGASSRTEGRRSVQDGQSATPESETSPVGSERVPQTDVEPEPEPESEPEPSPLEQARRLSLQASLATEAGDLEEALTLLDRGLTLIPGNRDMAAQRTLVQQRLDQQRLARQRAAQRDARLREIRSAMANENLAAAESQLQLAREEFPQASSEWADLDNELAQLRQALGPRIQRLVVSSEPLTALPDAVQPPIRPGRILHLGLAYANFKATNQVIQAILYDGARQIQLAQVAGVVRGPEGEAYLRLERPVAGFPEGGYQLEVVLGGRVLLSEAFRVEESPSP